MGCQSEVKLGTYLTFSVTTHDPESTHVSDADSPPVYYIYEDETGDSVLNGVMAKLDDANTTGFYTERVAITEENGFELEKSYNLYIEAEVNTHPGAISYGFRVVSEAVAVVAVSSAEAEAVAAGTVALTAFYTFSERLTSTSTQDLSSATDVWFGVKRRKTDTDPESIVLVSKVDGLLYAGGDEPTDSGWGSITVSGQAGAWNIDVKIEEQGTAMIDDEYEGRRQYAELKALIGGDTYLIWSGRANVAIGVVRAYE